MELKKELMKKIEKELIKEIEKEISRTKGKLISLNMFLKFVKEGD